MVNLLESIIKPFKEMLDVKPRETFGIEGYKTFIRETGKVDNDGILNKMKYNSTQDLIDLRNGYSTRLNNRREDAATNMKKVDDLTNESQKYLLKLESKHVDYTLSLSINEGEIDELISNGENLEIKYAKLKEAKNQIENFMSLNEKSTELKKEKKELSSEMTKTGIDMAKVYINFVKKQLKSKQLTKKLDSVHREFDKVEDFYENSRKIKDFYEGYLCDSYSLENKETPISLENSLLPAPLEKDISVINNVVYRKVFNEKGFMDENVSNRKPNSSKTKKDKAVDKLINDIFKYDIEMQKINDIRKHNRDVPFEIVRN
jgi:hypothetical protein